MLIDLDIHELWYLLEAGLKGSHLRSDVIQRFTDKIYDKLDEEERMNLFEWAVRLCYAWCNDQHFEPEPRCCGHDTEFVKRYHPLNQYNVTMTDGSTVRAFKMNGKYHITSTRYCAPEYITNVEQIDLSKMWEERKVDNVDYDTNILE